MVSQQEVPLPQRTGCQDNRHQTASRVRSVAPPGFSQHSVLPGNHRCFPCCIMYTYEAVFLSWRIAQLPGPSGGSHAGGSHQPSYHLAFAHQVAQAMHVLSALVCSTSQFPSESFNTLLVNAFCLPACPEHLQVILRAFASLCKSSKTKPGLQDGTRGSLHGEQALRCSASSTAQS